MEKIHKVDRRTIGIPAKDPEEAPIDLINGFNRVYALAALDMEANEIINTERIEWRNKD